MTVEERQRGVRPEPTKVQLGRIIEVELATLLAVSGNAAVLPAGVILRQHPSEIGKVVDAALLELSPGGYKHRRGRACTAYARSGRRDGRSGGLSALGCGAV